MVFRDYDSWEGGNLVNLYFFKNDIMPELNVESTVWIGTYISSFFITSADLERKALKAVDIGTVKTPDLEPNNPERTMRE